MAELFVTYVFPALIPALVAGIVSLLLGRKQSKSVQVDIEGKYKQLLDSEIEARMVLTKRFDELEVELRKYSRGYYYALRHIRRSNPDGEIPDFINWSTDKLRAWYKQ